MRKTNVVKNETAKPMYVQIDPWAHMLYLLPGEQVVLAIHVSVPHEDDFQVEEISYSPDIYQIVWLPNTHEFFFLENGVEIHYSEYGTNVVGAGPALCRESALKGSTPLVCRGGA